MTNGDEIPESDHELVAYEAIGFYGAITAISIASFIYIHIDFDPQSEPGPQLKYLQR